MTGLEFRKELSILHFMLWIVVTIGHVFIGVEAFKTLGFHEVWDVYWGMSFLATGFSLLTFLGLKDRAAPARDLWKEYRPDVFKTEHEKVMEAEPLYDSETTAEDVLKNMRRGD